MSPRVFQVRTLGNYQSLLSRTGNFVACFDINSAPEDHQSSLPTSRYRWKYSDFVSELRSKATAALRGHSVTAHCANCLSPPFTALYLSTHNCLWQFEGLSVKRGPSNRFAPTPGVLITTQNDSNRTLGRAANRPSTAPQSEDRTIGPCCS